ncbi:MAG: hypothetical protein KatS3mg131_0439 [Candidatus Tectimicrobiota bacterium]|nr:MAG: hypothetical protein KatS3mg131_0439 [Candidatus Tectomicrobia bacterium]
MRLLIWGAGELGGRVGALWAARGKPVLGFTRSTARHETLRRQGLVPQVGTPLAALAPHDALLLALPGSARQREALALLTGMPPVGPRRAAELRGGYYGTPQGRVH